MQDFHFGTLGGQKCTRNRPPLLTFSHQWAPDVIRWDEKAGLRRDAVRSQVIDVLEAQIKRRRTMKKVSTGGVARVFDLADTTNTVGAPLFAFFAKGGNYECLRRRSLRRQTPKRNLPPPHIHSHGTGLVQQIEPITGGVARVFDLADTTNTVGAPLFAFFAKGGNYECLRQRSLRRQTPKRNLPPPHIHSHGTGLVQQIEPITAPPPLLGRAHQSPLHRIPMHVPQLLHPLLRRPHVKVVEARLPE